MPLDWDDTRAMGSEQGWASWLQRLCLASTLQWLEHGMFQRCQDSATSSTAEHPA